MNLQKLVKKTNLSEEQIKDIIFQYHSLEKLIPKKQLKEISLNFNEESLKFVRKISKVLKVSNDAVISSAIINYLELKNEC